MNEFEIPLNILYKVLYQDRKSNEEINLYAKKTDNLPLATKIVYGVLENKIYLDYMIRKLSNIRLKKINPKILIILEMGIYNIHFLEKKDYAVVNELVNLTKSVDRRSKGFVNAILRNFIRDEKEIATIYERDDIKALSIRYSLPEDLTNYIYQNYGMDYTKKFLRYINSEQIISIRVNNLKTNKEDLKEKLEESGYKIEDGKISKNALRILNPAGLAESNEFKDGLFTIQQESSMKTIEVLDPKKGAKILDLCAAPGTKTSYIGEYIENDGEIIANDLLEQKLSLIKENIDRLGLKNIELTSFDAAILQDKYVDSFDYVLVDAPCSGLGVMGRKAEIRYNRSIEDIKTLAKLQRDILANAVKYLKTGGKLLYSTCTIGSIENKANFEYLRSMNDLELIPIDGKDYIEYVNFEDETDGFFISEFKKI
ncbi:16S rRNA (cytosine(967)-C(5))-methyltransferase RsmB [Anaerococcus sp. Marseille-Q7828]|uniref:16S rRNA (cytosine(967)-C(5))-methyltransferase RsmB n=1 Tax=Anaerococcus sp. Marseille-Q7828 TaxID=3036300 RepID=UPI0024ADAFFE|nr:16S rRNA (cytosine(967)-C(5))-methyltransferase RsmB [Anaerococcus sp. Marseille-Q7828]